ncbi:COG4223 family protein [Tardiphaga sp.]|jgi:hypothetical protein|uniref:COG4223 family protein n=1 Tax=Tardiphaga sp. TaxID=1926292 RepID=UPI0037D9FE1D
MADDNETGSVPNAGRPKRQPPTLELAATNVTERPKAGEEPAAPAPDVSPTDAVQPEAPAVDTSPSDMPPFAAEPAVEEATAPPRDKSALLLPIAAGAVAGAVVAAAAWVALTSMTPSDNAATEALAGRVAQLEARPVPKPDTGLATRIDGIEKSIATLRSDLTAAKTQSDRASAEINTLKSAPRAAAAVVDLAPITERLNVIERATGDLKSSAAQQSAKPVDDPALRRTVAAALLDTSVRQSEPYAAALAAVKPLAIDPAQLKPLDAFAASGVPNDVALSRELLVLLPKLTPASSAAPSPDTGFLDRLQAGAAKLVRIERTDAASSGNGSAVARAATAARSNDVATAKRELLTLAPADRTAVQPWLDKLAARDAALLASRQFAADAMAALSKPAP